MDLVQYQNERLSCLVPAGSRVVWRHGELVARGRPGTYMAIRVDPVSGIRDAFRFQIQKGPVISDSRVTRHVLRRGAFEGRWSGIELVAEAAYGNGMHEYGWWVLLSVGGSEVAFQIAGRGVFGEHETVWRSVLDSLALIGSGSA